MRTEFNNLVAVMNRYDLHQVNDLEVAQALKMLENKITELEQRMECAVKCAREIQDVTNKFEGSDGVKINLKPSQLATIERASNDVELALNLNDRMCVEDDWYGLFKEPKKEPEVVAPTELCKIPQTHEFVKDIIAKLKVIDVDGETMHYIIKQVGMNDQMLRQLVLNNPSTDTTDILEEKLNLQVSN